MKVGYARVSTEEQSIEVQRDALLAAGCDTVRFESITGTTLKGRRELDIILNSMMRDGDVLVVTKIDRLARNMRDMLEIVETLKEKGASLKVIDQPIDTGHAAGVAFMQMLSLFAEFEHSIRLERQMAGIRKAKEKGLYTGRKATIDHERIRALKAEGMGATEIANTMNIGRQSVYRVLKAS